MPTATGNSTAWAKYHPDEKAPWNTRRVVHLHRRAGFAATWNEIQRDLKEGHEASIQRLLDGEAYSDGVPDDFEAMSEVIGDAAVASGNPDRLKAWWLYRMIFSRDPLTERLALMWHNHFATSNLKVADIDVMRRQNAIFRESARSPFGELLKEVVKDPAMLIWLDADSNRKQHPNENLARELMELFTMGVGNYTETDVKEAARALTGWTTKRGQFNAVDAYHDPGEKTLLGRSGEFDGDDVLQIVVGQPATSNRLAGRLCEPFFGENAINETAIEELASGLRDRNLDINWAVTTILSSQAFFDSKNVGNRVMGPVEYAVGAIRALRMFDPPPSTLVLSEWTARLGQDLFYPPNVFGWAGGREWITTRSMIGRTAFANELISGSLRRPEEPLDIGRFAEQVDSSSMECLARHCECLLLSQGSDETRQRILETAASRGSTPEKQFRMIVEMLLASPEAQLG